MRKGALMLFTLAIAALACSQQSPSVAPHTEPGSAAGAGVGGSTALAGTGEAPGTGGSIALPVTTAGSGGLPDGPAPGDGDAGALLDAGNSDLEPEPTEPVQVPACGEDLQAVVGEARPDFGQARPAAAFAGDPGAAGAYGVWRSDVTIANPDTARAALDATFYAPSEDGGNGVAEGRFALVLVMHGFGTTHRNYEHMSTHLASHGLVVLGLTLPFALTAAHDQNAAEAIAAIDFTLSSAAPAALQGRVDAEKIAVAGHSFGGKIAFYAAAQDSRIDLVIGWDPSNAGGPPCFIDPDACNDFPVAPNCLADDAGIVHRLRAETLVFRAAADGANPEPAHNAIHFFRGAPAPATLVDFDDTALHGDWASAASAVVPPTRRVQLAFLLQRFYGRSGLDAFLPGGASIADGAVSVLYKP